MLDQATTPDRRRALRAGCGALLLVLAGAAFTGCGAKKEKPVTAASFVGKWRSSKLATPLILYQNGEWEIKPDGGWVQQNGRWEYRDGRIIWSYELSGTVRYDPNPVVSVSDREFRLREDDGITVFRRLE